MRFWFSQVPVYPQRVRDVTGLIFGGVGVAIAAAAAFPALSFGSRLLVTFGTWLLFGVSLLLAGRGWARRRGLPFVPLQEAKALNRAKEGARPLPRALLWFLPSGFLVGLIVAQIDSGHPFWQVGSLPWETVAATEIGTVMGNVVRWAKAPSGSRKQTGTFF